MPRETLPRARLIRIDINREGALLVATSASIPEFRIVAYTHEDLEDEIPASLQVLYRLKCGQEVEVVPVEPEETAYPVAYAALLGRTPERHEAC